MAFLREFGMWLPSRVVTNAEIGEKVGTDNDWIRNVSGIEERRFAAADETVAVMATRAAEDCLSRSDVSPDQIGMVIVASGSSERRFPGPATTAAQALGCKNAVALDLPLASAGALFGLSLASRLAEKFGHILVIGSEKMSSVVLTEPMERGVAVLFGDGAGACLVSADKGLARIVDSWLGSDGSYAEDLRLEFDRPLAMNGRSVILQASRKIPSAIQYVLDQAGVLAQTVQVYLMHQANQNLIDRVAQAIGVSSERFYSNIRRYGNTSSASMLIAATEWSREVGFATGEPVVFAAFGAGFNWGALLVEGE
ncbi:MAG: ketoacyl-ACP synthase III [Acidobacteria bacterium]|nr:ketoacyl-ACP synthase III [Acidobacteriota bacterium]